MNAEQKDALLGSALVLGLAALGIAILQVLAG